MGGTNSYISWFISSIEVENESFYADSDREVTFDTNGLKEGRVVVTTLNKLPVDIYVDSGNYEIDNEDDTIIGLYFGNMIDSCVVYCF